MAQEIRSRGTGERGRSSSISTKNLVRRALNRRKPLWFRVKSQLKRINAQIFDRMKSLLRWILQRRPFLCILVTLLVTLLGAILSVSWLPSNFGVGYNFWRSNSVYSPLAVPKAVNSAWRNESIYSKRLWGSYRPNVYFGMRPRIPNSLLFGMMWFSYDDNGGKSDIRHTCENTDNLQRYSWIRHDGTSFGQQEILDNYLHMKTDFITDSDDSMGGAWTARIRADSQSPVPILASFIFYLYNEGEGDLSFKISSKNSIEGFQGHTPEFKNFGMIFKRNETLLKDAVHSRLSVHLPSIVHLSEFMKSVMEVSSVNKKGWPSIAQLPGDKRDPKARSNYVAYQVTTYLPFEIYLTFKTSGALTINDYRFTSELMSKIEEFDERFEDTFQLKAKGISESHIRFAKAALSSLIGGIGYFYGESKVISRDQTEPLDYWPAPLYTAVPSRSSFPHGFLWDEGFHQLLIAHWDTSIAKDVIAHWLDLMNVDGWIPREQILGEEARSKVPAEFIIQHNENANPPTFFLTLETLLQQMQREDKADVSFLKHIYPRLKQWFQWFNTTQAGKKPLTYRWRGRNKTDSEVNPKTLTSGFDDFPRAPLPTPEEYHVDLRCWMTLASGVMAKIAELLGEDSTAYELTHKSLFDQTLLDELHWNTKLKRYSDYGRVKIESDVHPMPPVKKGKDSIRFIASFGYVNLFPFFLKQVSPSSNKLKYLLNSLSNESLLWSRYGLRSLSKSDKHYNKYNTEHDPPYWRGSIWINMNYLACRALHHYGNVEGPYRQKAEKLYHQLRSNLIDNMYTQYLRTGYIWEQYDDDIGSGKGTRPFTGWSSLIVLIMAEKY